MTEIKNDDYVLPGDFVEELTTKFHKAVEDGDIVFSESTTEDLQVNGINIQLRLVPALAKKVESDYSQVTKDAQSKEEESKLKNPFENPDPNLVITTLGQDYLIVFNKFSVSPYHFMLITKTFQSQSAPPSPKDLCAVDSVIHAIHIGNKDYKLNSAPKTGGPQPARLIAFYNCGPNSGASQPHRHVQFLPIDASIELFPDEACPQGTEPIIHKKVELPYRHPRIPFIHFIMPLDRRQPLHKNEEEIALKFVGLFSRTMTALKAAGHSPSNISFNLALTRDWIIIIPRIKEAYVFDGESISINTLGMLGLILTKTQKQFDLIKEKGPLNVLKEVGLPRETGDRVTEEESKETEYDY